ncbi:DUF883 family protein [Pelomicrobium sp.]|jgi:ElaB/YqjD/DUF883 family membrane-anchored ribosome-binding protein|uniref:DUF883 family protein n=1 Tax=unclassified Pelomicrobium TaxID=2815318 RepID=UPI0021DECA4B|nr:MAG: hypothetical protein KatS3mg123_0657 [Burkholderiales bacterium]
MNDTTSTTSQRDKLMADLKVVLADAEELLKLTASQAGERVSAARERVQASLEKAKVRLAELEGLAAERTRIAAKATDEFVHEHPWKAVGIAAGVGLIVGLLIGRR